LTPAPDRIAIGIATCRRQKTLTRLLDSLAAVRTPPHTAVSIVVVDNDAEGSSRAVCAGAALPWPLDYRVEPRRGIPFARNALVRACLESHDALVFIDDDEVPEPGWLVHLCDARHRFGAQVVTGPAVPRFETPPPQWAIDGGFFDFPRFPTGTIRDVAFTNNVLVDCAIFRASPAWFDERLQFTGGSDTHFFRRLHLAGSKIVWCDEAAVHDFLPADRVTLRWVLQRAYRYGHTHAFVRADLKQDTRAGLVLSAVLRLRQVAASLVIGVVTLQRARLIDAARETAYLAGMLANLAGAEYAEYRSRGQQT
jgi:GT2 family glycosyltransferase